MRSRSIVGQLGACCLLALGAGQISWFGSASAATPPKNNFSYYVNTADQTTWYDLGYDIGAKVLSGIRPENEVVVLAFGAPDDDGTYYGADDFAAGYPFVSVPTIRDVIEQFGKGFYLGTGSDTAAILHIAVATSNSGSWVASPTDDYADAYNHGLHWSDMLGDCNSWLFSNGYSSQVTCNGAIDAEVNWSVSAVPERWATGYTDGSGNYFYDSGDAAGCPYRGSASGTWLAGNCVSGGYTWSQDDVWYMSWGNSQALPLPEII